MKLNLNQAQRLKIGFIATVVGAAAIEGTVLAQKHHVPTGKDAFAHYQVDSTNELITMLKSNPTLRRNYAHHFGIPEDQVVDFVKRTLVPYRLPQSASFTTYGVTKSGHIYPVHTFLKKGTLVWATRSGLPVLKWACANPLVTKLPGTLLASRPHLSKNVLANELPPVSTVPGTALPPGSFRPLAGVAAPELAAPSQSVTSAITLPISLSGAGSTTVPAVGAPIPVTLGTGSSGKMLPLIPILVGVGLLDHSSGSSTGPASGSTSMPATAATPTSGGGTVIPTPGPGGTTVVPTPAPSGTGEVVPTPAPSGTGVIVPTPAPSGTGMIVPTPAPSGTGVVVPTPEPSGTGSDTPTPSPSGSGVVVPTPAPSGTGVAVPTPAPSDTTVVPTPAPSVPVIVPTPVPSGPGVPNTPPIPPANSVPEPGALALIALAGIPAAGGLIARRRSGRK